MLSVVLTIALGLLVLYKMNPPGKLHEYRGVMQTVFQKLYHDRSMTFYGPLLITARWGNEHYWHEMVVQDLNISWVDYQFGKDGDIDPTRVAPALHESAMEADQQIARTPSVWVGPEHSHGNFGIQPLKTAANSLPRGHLPLEGLLVF